MGTVRVGNPRFSWLCPDGPRQGYNDRDWTTAPEGTNFVIVKREPAGSEASIGTVSRNNAGKQRARCNTHAEGFLPQPFRTHSALQVLDWIVDDPSEPRRQKRFREDAISRLQDEKRKLLNSCVRTQYGRIKLSPRLSTSPQERWFPNRGRLERRLA